MGRDARAAGGVGHDARRSGFAFAAVSALGFGSGPAIAKPILPLVPLPVVLAWRFGIGALVCWAWVIVSAARWRAAPSLAGASWGRCSA